MLKFFLAYLRINTLNLGYTHIHTQISFVNNCSNFLYPTIYYSCMFIVFSTSGIFFLKFGLWVYVPHDCICGNFANIRSVLNVCLSTQALDWLLPEPKGIHYQLSLRFSVKFFMRLHFLSLCAELASILEA